MQNNDSNNNSNDKQLSSPLKAIISGGCVLTEMSLGGIFMENLKMEKQRTSLGYPVIARNLLGQGLKG